MQEAVTLSYRGMTLRGMVHRPKQESAAVPAVILFHGYTGTKLEPHRLFLKISRALEEQGIASFRFDFLGSGESDGNFEDMTLANEVAEANAILDMVRNDPGVDSNRVILLGLSMGGLIASLVAGERPQDVHRLVLLAPAATISHIADEWDRENVTGEVTDRVTIPGRNIAFDNDGNLVGVGFVDSIRNLDAYSVAKGYNGPVLLIHGTRDEAVSYLVSHEYKARCYGDEAQMHIIDGADHTFNRYVWEKEVIESITQFLQ